MKVIIEEEKEKEVKEEEKEEDKEENKENEEEKEIEKEYIHFNYSSILVVLLSINLSFSLISTWDLFFILK